MLGSRKTMATVAAVLNFRAPAMSLGRRKRMSSTPCPRLVGLEAQLLKEALRHPFV